MVLNATSTSWSTKILDQATVESILSPIMWGKPKLIPSPEIWCNICRPLRRGGSCLRRSTSLERVSYRAHASDEVVAVASDVAPTLATTQAPSAVGDRRLWLIPVAVCVVAVVTSGWRQWRHRNTTPTSSAIRSLAVLPLENLSGDPSHEYLADGILPFLPLGDYDGGICLVWASLPGEVKLVDVLESRSHVGSGPR